MWRKKLKKKIDFRLYSVVYIVHNGSILTSFSRTKVWLSFIIISTETVSWFISGSLVRKSSVDFKIRDCILHTIGAWPSPIFPSTINKRPFLVELINPPDSNWWLYCSYCRTAVIFPSPAEDHAVLSGTGWGKETTEETRLTLPLYLSDHANCQFNRVWIKERTTSRTLARNFPRREEVLTAINQPTIIVLICLC